jgi:hypothetical protein
MMTASNEKNVFIDTSALLDCAKSQVEGLSFDTLKDLWGQFKEKRPVLLLPENIEAETFFKLKEDFEGFKKIIARYFKGKSQEIKESRLVQESLKKAEELAVEKIEEKFRSASEIIKNLFSLPDTKRIPISDKVIMAGIKRSVLKRAPFSNPLRGTVEENGAKRESAHTKDQDCIAFEAILDFLRANSDLQRAKLVVCVRDSDYLVAGELREDIRNDVCGLCGEVRGYESPLTMLQKEFAVSYTEENLKEFDEKLRADSFELSLPLTAPSLLSGYNSGLHFGAPMSIRGIGSTVYSTPFQSTVRACTKCGTLFLEGVAPDTLLTTVFLEDPICSGCRGKKRGDSASEFGS